MFLAVALGGSQPLWLGCWLLARAKAGKILAKGTHVSSPSLFFIFSISSLICSLFSRRVLPAAGGRSGWDTASQPFRHDLPDAGVRGGAAGPELPGCRPPADMDEHGRSEGRASARALVWQELSDFCWIYILNLDCDFLVNPPSVANGIKLLCGFICMRLMSCCK
jgi:hypothetical protein